MFICRNSYNGLVTGWTLRQEVNVSLQKCVWCGNKLDSTSKRKCFSPEMCMVWLQVGQYVKKGMFLCRHVYGLVTVGLYVKRRIFLCNLGAWFLKKTQTFSVHGRKKCVWSENKFDSTSKRECFFAIWVHGHLKRRHLCYMVESKNVYGL